MFVMSSIQKSKRFKNNRGDVFQSEDSDSDSLSTGATKRKHFVNNCSDAKVMTSMVFQVKLLDEV